MADSPTTDRAEYVVVARRYRPQGFDDLVGQEMVAQALKNAIQTDRVGHAYLFTGARGVGKTSTARILSKALNCQQGPAPEPCHQCDICQSIAAGEDVDVLEIDGASNRGIDEIRQLRSNVSVRPSRSRYKIYIIDEVHMLTKEAFNALLKTLEEPPEHVKFIFCTTDPEKIPITVLSRCQRFDFSPVQTPAIVQRLQFIVETEGAKADVEALELLARRAAGSMRDSQSLLEQLLSFTSTGITVAAVHGMLGTADSARLHGVTKTLARHDAAGALRELDQAIGEGVDAGQLAEQLLGCLRDLLVLSVGGGKELLLHGAESEASDLAEIATEWGTANLLAAAQILDQSIARMRVVTHSRILLETALVRIAHLEDQQQLAELVAEVRSGSPMATAAPVGKKKTADPIALPDKPAAAADKPNGKSGPPAPAAKTAQSLTAHAKEPLDGAGAAAETAAQDSQNPTRPTRANAEQPIDRSEDDARPAEIDATALWRATIARLEGVAADYASQFESVANFAPNRLVVTFPAVYNSSKLFCQRPEKHGEMQRIVSAAAGKKLKLEFAVREDGPEKGPPKPAVSARQRERQVSQQPFVQRAIELFSANVSGVHGPKRDG